jgi:hypothetical protein
MIAFVETAGMVRARGSPVRKAILSFKRSPGNRSRCRSPTTNTLG